MVSATTVLAAIWVIPAFALAWAWARKISNYSLIDALWAYAIGITAVSWLTLGEGEAYREYQRSTSAFIPLPPRSPSRP